MKRVIVLSLLMIFPALNKAQALDEFVRGTWLTYTSVDSQYFHCVPGVSLYHPDSVNWNRELYLLYQMRVNVINSFLQFEHYWMDSVCNKSNGEIKMYVGVDSPYGRTNFLVDSLNLGFWYGTK